MKHLILKMALIIICAISAGLMGCSGSSGNSDNDGMVNRGSWYVTGHEWPHDGHPLESENFVIYSDAASLEARQLLSEICEETFVTIKERLGITDVSIFRFPADRNNKVHIYAYKNYYPMFWLAVRYLMDPDGQGGSFYDVRDVLIDVANGVQFSTSLEDRFGISVIEFEDQFFDLMYDYLP